MVIECYRWDKTTVASWRARLAVIAVTRGNGHSARKALTPAPCFLLFLQLLFTTRNSTNNKASPVWTKA